MEKLKIDNLEKQTIDLVKNYFDEVVNYVDKQFGKGYSKDHPELIGLLVQSCVNNSFKETFSKSISELTDSIYNISDVLMEK
jgi:hypothetical protein